MRRLKLQMQISADGFASGPNGELDWMTWNWDDGLKDFVTKLTEPVDTILLGRKMTDAFISTWSAIANDPENPEHKSGQKFIDTPKVVFSKTLTESLWPNSNTEVANDLVSTVNELKNKDGNDIMVYGGPGLVSNLVKENLIDDYYLFVNPTAIGKGLQIFGANGSNKELKLIDSTAYECGVVVNHYRPAEA